MLSKASKGTTYQIVENAGIFHYEFYLAHEIFSIS
jgi:hypothetical protein